MIGGARQRVGAKSIHETFEARFDQGASLEWIGTATLRSGSDTIDARLAFDAPQWRVELFDIVAREQLANGGNRIERFRETDFAGAGE